MKFRLNVHKMKCTNCDLVFLVEDINFHEPMFTCPCCEDTNGDKVEYIEDIVVVQE